MISASVQGMREAYAALSKAAKKIQRDGSRKAANAGGKVVLKAMKGAVRVRTGLLKKALGRKVKSFGDSGVSVAIIGPRTGFKVVKQKDGSTAKVQTKFSRLDGTRVNKKGETVNKYSNPTQYAHLVDKGTRRSRAYPFRAPVQQATAGQVRDAMAEAVRAVVEGASS
jgi:HK97 gp10 family phage protein